MNFSFLQYRSIKTDIIKTVSEFCTILFEFFSGVQLSTNVVTAKDDYNILRKSLVKLQFPPQIYYYVK